MTVNQPDWAQLNSTFEQDLKITKQLMDRLRDERLALETRHYERFQQLTGEKQTLLGLLESHMERRRQWFISAGLNDEKSALAAAKQQAPSIAKQWHALAQQWAQCQQLNEVNQQIANRTHAVVGKMLDVLRGQTRQQPLYTNKGDTEAGSSGRTISSA